MNRIFEREKKKNEKKRKRKKRKKLRRKSQRGFLDTCDPRRKIILPHSKNEFRCGNFTSDKWTTYSNNFNPNWIDRFSPTFVLFLVSIKRTLENSNGFLWTRETTSQRSYLWLINYKIKPSVIFVPFFLFSFFAKENLTVVFVLKTSAGTSFAMVRKSSKFCIITLKGKGTIK